jgi:hypothetical protein
MRVIKRLAGIPRVAARAAGFAALLAVPVLGWGGAFQPPPNSVPEPESLALIGIGAVAWMIARWKKRK